MTIRPDRPPEPIVTEAAAVSNRGKGAVPEGRGDPEVTVGIPGDGHKFGWYPKAGKDQDDRQVVFDTEGGKSTPATPSAPVPEEVSALVAETKAQNDQAMGDMMDAAIASHRKMMEQMEAHHRKVDPEKRAVAEKRAQEQQAQEIATQRVQQASPRTE